MSADGGAVAYQRREAEKAAVAVAKVAVTLQQQDKNVKEQPERGGAFWQQADQKQEAA
jgi:hypothetical protein